MCCERFWSALCAAVLLTLHCQLWAGQSCATVLQTPENAELAALAASGLKRELDAAGVELAVVARIGQDLSAQGLLYSHAAFAVREQGSWRVLHLLNNCGGDDGQLYREGLVEFFSDELLRYQAKVIYLQPELAQEVLKTLQQHQGKALFEPRYSVIARFDSARRQNSTAWLIEVIVASVLPGSDSRAAAHAELKLRAYQPSVIAIRYRQRIAAGLFRANAVFTDHPLSARLAGKYPVHTAHSIFEFLRQQHWVASERTLVVAGAQPLLGE